MEKEVALLKLQIKNLREELEGDGVVKNESTPSPSPPIPPPSSDRMCEEFKAVLSRCMRGASVGESNLYKMCGCYGDEVNTLAVYGITALRFQEGLR